MKFKAIKMTGDLQGPPDNYENSEVRVKHLSLIGPILVDFVENLCKSAYFKDLFLNLKLKA